MPRGLVVSDFMSGNVLTIHQEKMVDDAVEAMAESDIGSMVVLDGAGPCGLFTERDLLAKVIAVGKDIRTTAVKDVLSARLPTAEGGMTAEEAAVAMIRERSRLVVFNGANLSGIITPTDIVRVISGLDYTFDICDVISRRIVSVYPETPILTAVQRMWQRGVGSVIIQGSGGPLGIFTERDLLKKVLMLGMPLDRSVTDVMSIPLIITPDDGIQAKEVARMMATHHIKRMPLYSGNRMVAMVTARDLVEAFAAHAGRTQGVCPTSTGINV